MPRFIGTPSTLPTTGAPFDSGTLMAGKDDAVAGLVFSNTAGNLHVDQSINGVNWDLTDSVAVAASTGTRINVALVAPYYRVRYVPTTDPATFRLALRSQSSGYRG